MQGNNELCVPVIRITVWDYSIISPQNHMRKKSHAQCTAFYIRISDLFRLQKRPKRQNLFNHIERSDSRLRHSLFVIRYSAV